MWRVPIAVVLAHHPVPAPRRRWIRRAEWAAMPTRCRLGRACRRCIGTHDRHPATFACPACGTTASENMPANACQHYYVGQVCGATLSPRPGNCCVVCSVPILGARRGEARNHERVSHRRRRGWIRPGYAPNAVLPGSSEDGPSGVRTYAPRALHVRPSWSMRFRQLRSAEAHASRSM